ncbi:MAG: EamA family transporter [Spirochaetales bacterium]|nr:EamA family transporter [Spirochaetales bacterium]
MSPAVSSILSLVLCAILWSIGGLFIKMVDWTPIGIAGLRSLLGGLTILLFVRKPKITFSVPQLLAALCNASTMILFVYANKLTTSANAILLQYGAPLYVAVFAWILLKEKPNWEQWIGLLLILGGMVLFFREKVAPGNAVGNILAVISGFTFAFYTIFMRMQKEGSPVESILLSHALVFLFSLPWIVRVPPSLSLEGWTALVVLGVFQIGISSVLFARGIKNVPAIQTMLITTLEPILNPLWVFLFLNEKPSTNALMGGALIILAVLFSSLVSAHRARRG